MTEANPEGIDILDGEINCIKDKLDDLDREIDGSANEWKELKSLVGVVREELERSTKEALSDPGNASSSFQESAIEAAARASRRRSTSRSLE